MYRWVLSRLEMHALDIVIDTIEDCLQLENNAILANMATNKKPGISQHKRLAQGGGKSVRAAQKGKGKK